MNYVHYIPNFGFSFIVDQCIYDEWVRHVIDFEINKMKTPINETEILLSFWNELELYIEPTIEIIKSYNFKKITIVADISQKLTCDNINDVNINYMNIWPLVTKNFQSQSQSLLNPRWSPNLKKGLFLAGADPRRKNRIGLLKKLFDKELLQNNITWTSPHLKEYYSTLINFFPNIDNTEFDNFINHCDKHATVIPGWFVDAIKNKICGQEMIKLENDLLINLYKQTNFSIVAETFYDNHPPNKSPFLTEKIYRTIFNKHPFVLAAPPMYLNALKEMGFRTFENYLPNPHYDTILDADERLDAIVDNVAAFPNAIIKNQDVINEDVEYNYALLNTIISNELKIITTLCNAKKIPIDTFEFYSLIDRDITKKYIINSEKFNKQHESIILERKKTQNFINSYNNIKAENWPIITNLDDFYKLSMSIQEECKTVFGLDLTRVY